MTRRTFLKSLALSVAAVPAFAGDGTGLRQPRGDLYSYDRTRRLPWNLGAQYTSDAYPWHVANSQPISRLFLNGQNVSDEYGTLDMDLPRVWSNTRSSSAPVAVIDSLGFDSKHQCLFPNVVHAEQMNGKLPVAHNHGTQVAGLIGATGNNSFGAVGVCWTVPLILLGTNARLGVETWVIELVWAITKAVELGAKIICLPQGIPGADAIHDALLFAGAADVLVVCAALNNYSDHDTATDYPTSWRLSNVLTISNCMRDGQLLPGGAGFGAQTVFAGAPGRRLPVLMANNRYGFASGTSEACGVAAGIIALFRSYRPRMNYAQVRTHIQANVLPVPALAGQTISGGMLHADIFNGLPEAVKSRNFRHY